MSLDIHAECPTCGHRIGDQNITHNLVPLWKHLGIYEVLYECEGFCVEQVLPILREGLAKAKAEGVTALSRFDSTNGWGLAEHAIPWLADLVEAWSEAPAKATVRVSR